MSGDSGLNELNRALGEVAAKVDGLPDQLADSDRRASEHRNRLYRRVEDIAVRAHDCITTVTEYRPSAYFRHWSLFG